MAEVKEADSIPRKLSVIRQSLLADLVKRVQPMEKGSSEKELISTFVESRTLLTTLKLPKSVFLEEVSWIKQIPMLQRWVYSNGRSENESLDEVQEALAKRVFNLEATLLASLVKGNPAAAKSTTFENDLTELARKDMNTSFLFGAKCNSQDYRVLIRGLPVGEARTLLPLTPVECAMMEHVQEFTNQQQEIVLAGTSPDTRDYVRCIPDASECSVDQFYNNWIVGADNEELTQLDGVYTQTSISTDGMYCGLDNQRLGQMARLILYFKDKYGDMGLRVRPSMSDERLLLYCMAPVSTGELLREVLYYDKQGDLNPFVFLAGNPDACKEYARSVLNRVNKVIPRAPPLNLTLLKREKHENGDAKKIQVVDHVLCARFRVIGHKAADPNESEWVCEEDILRTNFALVNAIMDYKRTSLTFKGYELKE